MAQQEQTGVQGWQVLYGLGIAIGIVPIFRAVTGYYSSDAVWMLPMLVVAGVMIFIAQRMKS